MKLLSEDEHILTGGTTYSTDNQIVPDEVTKRIYELISNALVKVSTDWSGWDTLFVDPKDGRLWERIYPHSELHGGGSPELREISRAEAEEKYRIDNAKLEEAKSLKISVSDPL